MSVPVAAGTWLDASAAPEPPLEPPAERSRDQGLPTWSVVPPQANSCVCRWPSRTMPAAERLAQASQSRSGTSSRTRLEAVSGLPGDGVEVLQPDRDPAELGRAARREPLVGARRRLERVLLVDAHPGVDRARVAVVRVGSVPLADSREAGVDELARRERARPERGGRLEHSEIGGIGSRGDPPRSDCYESACHASASSGSELRDLPLRERAHHAPLERQDVVGVLGEQRSPHVGEPYQQLPSVLGVALPRDEPALLENARTRSAVDCAVTKDLRASCAAGRPSCCSSTVSAVYCSAVIPDGLSSSSR